MCKHEYQIPSFKADSNVCYLPKIFSTHNILDTEVSFKLPHDDMGLCLFHSNQKEFKKKFDFPKVLDSFIDYCNENKFELIDLRGIIIDTADSFSLEGKTIIREINLCKAKITAPFSIINCHLHGDVFFDQAIFTNILSIENSTFSGNFTATGGTVFNKNVHLSNVEFADLFDISHANFMNQINFNPVTFNGRTIFDNVAFRGQHSFIYLKITSRDTIEFNQTIFGGQVQFENCVFDGDVIFQDTKFNDPLYFANPDIGGTVIFSGLSESQKIFTTGIEMAISESCFRDAGQIIFENANLIYLDGKTKSQLAYLEKNRRIVLGEGTVVFRFSFQEFYPYSALDELFIADLLGKIKQYFDYKLNKHFEFTMSRVEEEIIITFFTDDYVRQEDFKAEQFSSARKLLDINRDETRQDKVEIYLHDYFTNLVNGGLKELIQANIYAKTLDGTVSIENLSLHLNNSSIREIKTNQLKAAIIDKTTIYVGILKTENEPSFKLTDSQFNDLKKQLLDAQFSDNDLQFIKQELAQLKNQTTPISSESFSKQFQEFMLEKGIAVGDNLIASTLFLLLSKLLFGV